MDKAWKILEIDLIIEKIKNNLKTKKGLEILNLLKPSNDFSYITNELNKFNELDKYAIDNKLDDIVIFVYSKDLSTRINEIINNPKYK